MNELVFKPGKHKKFELYDSSSVYELADDVLKEHRKRFSNNSRL